MNYKRNPIVCKMWSESARIQIAPICIIESALLVILTTTFYIILSFVIELLTCFCAYFPNCKGNRPL